MRQWLSAEESAMIAQAVDDDEFVFAFLSVPVTGGDYYKDVLPRHLKLLRGILKTETGFAISPH